MPEVLSTTRRRYLKRVQLVPMQAAGCRRSASRCGTTATSPAHDLWSPTSPGTRTTASRAAWPPPWASLHRRCAWTAKPNTVRTPAYNLRLCHTPRNASCQAFLCTAISCKARALLPCSSKHGPSASCFSSMRSSQAAFDRIQLLPKGSQPNMLVKCSI